MKKKTYPHLNKMASGKMEIVLQAGVGYDTFPDIANAWVKRLKLRVAGMLDGVDVRMWDCRKKRGRFWLAHDDWLPEISLEPQDERAGALVHDIFDKLMKDMESEQSLARYCR